MPDWEQEDASIRTQRSSRAQEHINEGKTFKHAWYLAFQEFPRTTDPWKNATFKEKGNISCDRCNKETSSSG